MMIYLCPTCQKPVKARKPRLCDRCRLAEWRARNRPHYLEARHEYEATLEYKAQKRQADRARYVAMRAALIEAKLRQAG